MLFLFMNKPKVPPPPPPVEEEKSSAMMTLLVEWQKSSSFVPTTTIIALLVGWFLLVPRHVKVSTTKSMRGWIPLLVVSIWFYQQITSTFNNDDMPTFWWHLLAVAMFKTKQFFIHTLNNKSGMVLFTLWSFCVDMLLFYALFLLARQLSFLVQHPATAYQEIKEAFSTSLFDWAKQNITSLQTKLHKEMDNLKVTVATDILKRPQGKQYRPLRQIPEHGMDRTQTLQKLLKLSQTENKVWQSGKVSGTVYPCSKQHADFLNQVYAAFAWSNPLHTGMWPTVNQMEAEIIQMTSALLHGPGIGSTSSGGTESIILAIRAHYNYYHRQRRSSFVPEIIVGSSAHAAVDKACDLFHIRKIVIPCTAATNYCLDPLQVERNVTANTILIYSSAPSYPQGVVDPISDLGQIAQRHNIGLHVDACLGGFVLPFAPNNDWGEFDFRVPGVTSMSCDTHKFAYASKGTSVVLYANTALRQAQYFVYPTWSGGMYATPTLAGSRSGALLACAWASLVTIGQDGYRQSVASIMATSRDIVQGIRDDTEFLSKHLNCIGGGGTTAASRRYQQPPSMIVCLSSDTLDIYRVADFMNQQPTTTTSNDNKNNNGMQYSATASATGWSLNALQNPSSIHLCVTLNTVTLGAKVFLHDLKLACQAALAEGALEGKNKGTAAIYGMASSTSISTGPTMNEFLKTFVDATLTI